MQWNFSKITIFKKRWYRIKNSVKDVRVVEVNTYCFRLCWNFEELELSFIYYFNLTLVLSSLNYYINLFFNILQLCLSNLSLLELPCLLLAKLRLFIFRLVVNRASQHRLFPISLFLPNVLRNVSHVSIRHWCTLFFSFISFYL